MSRRSTTGPRVLALPNPIPMVAESVPPLPDRELEAMAGVLAAKSPDVPRAHVREVVEATYRRLAGTARVHSHLIPLTLNLSRSQLVRNLSATPGQSDGR